MKKKGQPKENEDKKVQKNLAIPEIIIEKAMIKAAEETIKTRKRVTEVDILLRGMEREVASVIL